MVYADIQDIQKYIDPAVLIQLTDDENTGQLNTIPIDEALLYSQTLIDGYLRGRYTLPLASIPKIITYLTIDLAVYRLYSRRLITEIPEPISEKYKVAIKQLEQIQKGIVSLGVETPGIAPELGEYRVYKTLEDREFLKDILNAY